jgi:hypothetical protein
MSVKADPGWKSRRILIAIAVLVAALCTVVLVMQFYPWKPVSPGPPVPVTPVPGTPLPTPTIPGPVILVAAKDSSQAQKTGADYICDGIDDQREIQKAFDSLSSTGGTVALTAGTFYCTGSILPAAKTMLKGEGSDATFLEFTRNGRLNVSQEYVTLYGFHAEGTGYGGGTDRWLGVITIYASHARVYAVEGTADASVQAVFMLMHDPSVYEPILEDVEFVDCRAVDTGTYGFLHNAWGTTNKVIKNVRYENCHAINCGRFGAFNPWVTGFDFAELNDIQGLRVNNCTAAGNLESGFHFEWDPVKTDVMLTNCISRNNGQKPYPTTADYKDYFGCGYYAPRGDVTFINCVSEGNSRHGFFISNGGKLYNCVDMNIGAGKTDYSIIQPASFYGAPTRSASLPLILENCTSIDSNGYGLQIDLASDVRISNFHLINPAGINGKATNLGGTYGGPLTNSVVNIYASGDRVETLIWARNNANVEYSGQIVSNTGKPFLIDGESTRNVLVRDMEFVSTNLGSAAKGVISTDAVPKGAVKLVNVAVTPGGSSTPAPAGKPDLVVTDVSWEPANPVAGTPVTLKATIKNQGTAGTPAGVVHGVLFTFDDGAAGPGVWSDSHKESLAPGASVTLTANSGSAGSTWKAVAGTCTITAYVDDMNRIPELEEANNTIERTLTVRTA